MAQTVLEQLIDLFGKLPGVGPRSARRIVLHLMKHQDRLMLPLAEGLMRTLQSIVSCNECGTFDITSPCSICTDSRRDPSIVCVVEDIGDLWAIERGGFFRGTYHVLGGTLSALDGRDPEALRIAALIAKASRPEIEEVILATNATVEGQTTAHYITEKLHHLPIRVSRLAQGIPIGGELDYLDEGTLSAALQSRHILHS